MRGTQHSSCVMAETTLMLLVDLPKLHKSPHALLLMTKTTYGIARPTAELFRLSCAQGVAMCYGFPVRRKRLGSPLV